MFDLKKILKDFKTLDEASENLNIPKSTLSLILNGKRNMGYKTNSKIMEYCKQKGINYKFFLA